MRLSSIRRPQRQAFVAAGEEKATFENLWEAAFSLVPLEGPANLFQPDRSSFSTVANRPKRVSGATLPEPAS
jgi:hypothetical protein